MLHVFSGEFPGGGGADRRFAGRGRFINYGLGLGGGTGCIAQDGLVVGGLEGRVPERVVGQLQGVEISRRQGIAFLLVQVETVQGLAVSQLYGFHGGVLG